jgi:hypothetical protein
VLDVNANRSTRDAVQIVSSLLASALHADRDYRLPIPTLLVHGDGDGMGVVVEGTRAWAEREPLGLYVTIPDAGHASNQDNPEIFTAELAAWFPGQEFGTALADVLFGHAEPGGRLPCTWPDREEDVPVLSTCPIDGVLRYEEGLQVGHRSWLRAGAVPAYPFGHGVGYTDWSYLDIDAAVVIGAAEWTTVTVRIRNTGSRPGKEVVQAYLSRPDSTIERPVRWLAGFAVVSAAPGAEVVAQVHLAARAFQHWSTPDRPGLPSPGCSGST